MLHEEFYREHPKTIVTIDGEQYIPLNEFCTMTGLSVYDSAFQEMKDQIIERPPTGGQRKPVKYISVKGWMALWERAFGLWLEERVPEEEVLTPWPWYGVKRVEAMLEFYLDGVLPALIDEGYLRLPTKDEPTVVKRDFILTEKGRATGWLRYRMRQPSPFGKWTATVVIDMSHIGFAAFIAYQPEYVESTHTVLLEIIQAAHDEREQAWRKRHPWIVAMCEYEAAAEAGAEVTARPIYRKRLSVEESA